ncbi:hypothetical protein [Streptomyces sp. 891-h]|uniref:DUF3846 domain-containing protein n=1 Tax=Streptomyces sp. 891-h TaxID=2720714 RepID=UPI001FA9C59C|nr:hypothetical protein [Streptomyces sp. 891-h]UNZ22325.1 hypothetical protein HC362_34735 [Streptomyces sp. 891-h]
MTDWYALLIKPNGEFRIRDWPTDTDHAATILRAEIGFLVNSVIIDASEERSELTMWVTDMGEDYGTPANFPATQLCSRYAAVPQVYHGPALFTGRIDEEKEIILGLTNTEIVKMALDYLGDRELDYRRSDRTFIPRQRTE